MPIFESTAGLIVTLLLCKSATGFWCLWIQNLILCNNSLFSFNYHQIVLSDDINDGEMGWACSMCRLWQITHNTLSGNILSNIPPGRPRPRCECDTIEFRSFEMKGTEVASNFRKARTTRLTTIYNHWLCKQCDIHIVLVRTLYVTLFEDINVCCCTAVEW